MFLGGALDEEPATGSFKVTLDCDASCRASSSERTVNSCTWSAQILGNKYSAQVEKATPCLTQKEPAGEKEWIFLINRTEHPPLAERVRCLYVGCDVTWGPPCQALVTRLPATRRR